MVEQQRAVVIGVFDGVHRGHAALIKSFVEKARQLSLTPVAVSFDPPPSLYFNPQFHFLLSTREERHAHLHAYGIEEVVFLDFTDVVGNAPRDFVKQQLVTLDVKLLMVGETFRFGQKRAGDVNLLRVMGENLGFRVETFPKERMEGEVISATRIRELLLLGHIERANQLLGYSYHIYGKRETGLGRAGALLGTPTVNMQPAHRHKLIPPDGIYAVRFGTQRHPGVCYIGSSPTFGDTVHRIEVHLLDTQPSLSLEPVVRFVSRLRPDKKFATIEELKSQVNADVKEARRVLSQK